MNNPQNGEELLDLAYDYIKGLNGKSIDEGKGGQLLLKAAEHGSVQAMLNLGTFYFGDKYGQPIYELPVDYKQGVYWLNKVIELSNGETKGNAMANLAICYIKGEGVPKDNEKAYQLCRTAATLDDDTAKHLLATYF